MGGTEVGQIDLGLNVNQSSFNKQVKGLAQNAQAPIVNAFKPIGKLIGSVLAIGAITKFTKECLELGSDLTEVQNVVDTTFKTLNGSVNEFAANAMKTYGMSETLAKQYIGTLGAMSKSMGFSEQASYDMSAAVTALTGDVASFYNLSTDEAFDKLKSIWTGETETLKSIGVLLTQTNLDQYALNNGFGKTTANMTEQEKVMLRYQYTMSALSDAQGDFAKTSGSWANQTKILSLQFNALKATLGQGFINLFTPIIQMVNALIGKLQILANQFKAFTELLTGNKGNSSGVASVAKNAEQATTGLNDMTDAAKSAAKATGRLSIDELNVISDTNYSSGGTSPDFSTINTGATETTGLIEKMEEQLGSFWKKLKKIAEDFKIGDFFNAGKDISDLVAGMFNFIAKAIKKINWVEIGNKIGEFLRGIDWLKIMGSLGNVLWEAVKGAASVWFGMFEEAPFETALITTIALWKFTDVGKMIGGLISKVIPTSYTKNLSLKIAAVAIAWEAGFDIGKEIGKLLFPDDKQVYEEFSWFGDNGFFKTVLNSDLEDLKNAFVLWGEDICKWWDEHIASWWNSSVAPWFTKEKWVSLFQNIKTAMSNKWVSIKTWWDNNALVKWWNDSVKPWFTKERWISGMIGIKDAFATVFKNACNAGIEKFNQFIKWINEKMHFKWEPLVIGGKEIVPGADFQLFTIPSIPMLAQGGYVGANQPQLAVIGDNKREGEIVSPESKLLDMAVKAAELANGGGNLSTELLMTIVELLTRIITILESMDLDIELDGRSLLQSLKESRSKLGHQF